jgi:hypothetical protein
MDELIRTLALFGRPFPPELRELYFEVAEKIASAFAAMAGLQKTVQMPPKVRVGSCGVTGEALWKLLEKQSMTSSAPWFKHRVFRKPGVAPAPLVLLAANRAP